jgi:hypothetical protein
MDDDISEQACSLKAQNTVTLIPSYKVLLKVFCMNNKLYRCEFQAFKLRVLDFKVLAGKYRQVDDLSK